MHDSSRRGLAVGFFDGVHLGHRAILTGAAEALTFRAHPLSVLSPARAPKLLMDFETRLAAIRACGVDRVTALDFTPDFAKLSPEEFAARHLAGRGPIRCGANWRFGTGGKGDADCLRRLGYEVEVVPDAESDGAIVSSTRIRAALQDGRLDEAERLLGHPWTLAGRVIPGKGEGRALGFPTVNVVPFEEPPLARGVYVVEVDGVPALANYGVAPTFGDRAWTSPVLEIHFPDSPGGRISARQFQNLRFHLGGPRSVAAADGTEPVPPEVLRLPPVKFADATPIVFRRFLRPERKFADRDELRAAIAADCEQLKALDVL